MTGVRLGGIDPSILRELSGVYKPFVKALKELVSNAFDADADHVHISIAYDSSSVTVIDDGEGMTPFEFRNDFTRIVGGSRRWLGERTRKGRLRIGSKGIGFLALARYCSRLEVESTGSRTFQVIVHLGGRVRQQGTKAAFAPEHSRTNGPVELSEGIAPPAGLQNRACPFRGTRLLS